MRPNKKHVGWGTLVVLCIRYTGCARGKWVRHPPWFHRFGAVWTPTVLLFDNEGKERVRLEGYLPNNDFMAALRNGLGRIAFVHKKYADAERWYGEVVARFTSSHFAPEAMY